MNNNIVITGANRGIGLALVERFKQQGDNVYALCRLNSDELNALDVNVITGVDVATDETTKRRKTMVHRVELFFVT